MIDSQETLADYIFVNRDRLGADGLMIGKALFQTMNNERGLNWPQIESVLAAYKSHDQDYMIGVAGGILEGMLYPDNIFNFVEVA
jgi:hypothetical protein